MIRLLRGITWLVLAGTAYFFARALGLVGRQPEALNDRIRVAEEPEARDATRESPSAATTGAPQQKSPGDSTAIAPSSETARAPEAFAPPPGTSDRTAQAPTPKSTAASGERLAGSGKSAVSTRSPGQAAPVAKGRSRRRWGRVAAVGTGVAVLAVLGSFLVLGGTFDSSTQTGSGDAFLSAAAPAPPPASTWPQYGLDRQRTRAVLESDIAPPFERQWSFDAGSLLEFPPVIDRGALFVGTNQGLAVSLDTETGEERWITKLGGRMASSPAVAGNVVLFATLKGDLVALRRQDGAQAWRLPLGAPSESSPLVVDGTVFLGTLAGRVLSIDLATRKINWEAQAAGDVKSSLAVAGDNVVVGDYGGRVTAWGIDDGALAWQTESPGTLLRGAGRFYAGPAVAYGLVFVGNINGRVVALSARTGEIAWVRVLDDFVYSSAAIADEDVFVGSYDEGLYSLDAATGEINWRFDAGERISGSPTVIGDLVYASTIAREPSEGRTFAVDRETGKEVWFHPDGRYSPAVSRDDLLIITGVRTLYGFRPR